MSDTGLELTDQTVLITNWNDEVPCSAIIRDEPDGTCGKPARWRVYLDPEKVCSCDGYVFLLCTEHRDALLAIEIAGCWICDRVYEPPRSVIVRIEAL